MGLGTYFKAPKPVNSNDSRQKQSALGEKLQLRPTSQRANTNSKRDTLRPPSRLSVSSSIQSGRSARSFVDDIKHEVMVNYLHQQQCSQLWVSDRIGESEGVLLRKARNQYLACPSQLAQSNFAMACAALNVQVSLSLFDSNTMLLTSYRLP